MAVRFPPVRKAWSLFIHERLRIILRRRRWRRRGRRRRASLREIGSHVDLMVYFLLSFFLGNGLKCWRAGRECWRDGRKNVDAVTFYDGTAIPNLHVFRYFPGRITC